MLIYTLRLRRERDKDIIVISLNVIINTYQKFLLICILMIMFDNIFFR